MVIFHNYGYLHVCLSCGDCFRHCCRKVAPVIRNTTYFCIKLVKNTLYFIKNENHVSEVNLVVFYPLILDLSSVFVLQICDSRMVSFVLNYIG